MINSYGPLVSILLALVVAGGSVVAGSSTVGEGDSPEALVVALTRAIDHFDHAAFVDSFSPEVSMFYPIPALGKRVDGREALAETQAGVFATLRARFAEEGVTEPPFFGLKAIDRRVQWLGDDAAVVTWHVDRGTHLGRRTAVVQRGEGGWRIVSYHASNVPHGPAASTPRGTE